MTRYVILLLGARLRLLYNSFRRGKLAAKIGWIVAGLGLLVLALGSGWAGYGLSRLLELLQEPDLLAGAAEAGLPLGDLDPETLLRGLLSTLVLGAWGVILMSSLGAALGNFYLTSDLDLLMAAPIPRRAIFAAKFLEGLGLAYLLLFFLGGPALFGLGLGAGYPWPYYVGALLFLLLLPLLPEAIGTLLIMPLVRIIPPRRLREVLQVLGALMGTAFYFFSQLPQGQEIDPQQAGQVLGWLQRLNMPFLPQGWAAQGLLSLGAGRYPQGLAALGAFALLSLGLYALCLFAAERLYHSGWASLQSAPPTARRRRARRRAETPEWPAGALPFLPQPLQGILAKDLRLFLRDPQGWSQMLMPLAVYALFLFQTLRDPSAELPGGDVFLPVLGGAIVLFLTVSMVSRLALGAVGGERQQIWLLKCAPISSYRVLWAKLLAAYLPFLGFSGLLLLVLTIVAHSGWGLFLGNWLLVGLVGLGQIAISVGLGASFPRLEGEKPQQVVSTGAGCLYFPLVMIYALLVVAALLGPALLDPLLRQLGWAALSRILRVLGPLGALALSALALWLPLRVGAGRLDRLEV